MSGLEESWDQFLGRLMDGAPPAAQPAKLPGTPRPDQVFADFVAKQLTSTTIDPQEIWRSAAGHVPGDS